MLSLERIGIRACFKVVILDRVTLAFQQVLRFQPVRAHVPRHYHSVKFGSFNLIDLSHAKSPVICRLFQAWQSAHPANQQ